MTKKYRTPKLAEVLGPALRSGIPEFEALARKVIAEKTKSCATEIERAAALGVSNRVWTSWRLSGAVESLGRSPGKPPKFIRVKETPKEMREFVDRYVATVAGLEDSPKISANPIPELAEVLRRQFGKALTLHPDTDLPAKIVKELDHFGVRSMKP